MITIEGRHPLPEVVNFCDLKKGATYIWKNSYYIKSTDWNGHPVALHLISGNIHCNLKPKEDVIPVDLLLTEK